MADERVHAVLVYGKKGPVAELKPFFDRHAIRTTHARNCAETAAALSRAKAPTLILTDTFLEDGSWTDVQTLAERSHPPVPVIVVSQLLDIPLYLDVLERGASDFIVPPFRDIDLDHIVRGALLNRVRTQSAPLRTTAGLAPEVARNAQNYTRSGIRAFHAESGR